MRIGYILASQRGEADRLLTQLAETLTGQGLRLAGAVQQSTVRANGSGCDMDLQVLGTDHRVRISQALGAGSTGCRLDGGALEEAVGLATLQLAKGADLLIVNKFGKHEALGDGFRGLIATAVMEGVPVVLGLSATNLPAFDAFAGEFAERIAADPAAAEAWAMVHAKRGWISA